jgi:RNA polymerase sigma factor (sigma-70 family)
MRENQLLWKSFLQGNKEALATIFLLFHDDLFRYGLKLAGNNDLVEDSLQDLFLQLWKNRQNLRQIDNLKPYLFKSFRNHIIDNIELQNPVIPIEIDFEHPFEVTYSPEDFIIQQQVSEENQIKIAEALNNLSSRQREAIYLRYFEDLDFDMIAIIMDMNVQSVRNTLHRGLQSLRNIMLMHLFLLATSRFDFLS